MAISKQVTDEIKKIMLHVTLQTILTVTGVIVLVLVLANAFDYEITTASFIITLLIIGSLMAFIGNGFVAHATTRYDATESILWIWGNRIQAIGFIITLIAAFL